MKFLPIFNAICLAFTIQLKQTHTGVEKRSKTITLPGTFPDLSLQKGDKVAFNAETQDEFEQLILAINDNAGDSHSFHLKSQVDQSKLPAGNYDCTVYAVMGDEKKSFAVGKVRITGETASKDLPELFHTFKPEQDHGNLLLAIIFTVLTMSPILVLGQLWTRLDVKLQLKKFEFWPWIYLMCLGVSLSVFHLFWLKLNLFQFFGLATPVMLLTIFTGKKALTLHASKI